MALSIIRFEAISSANKNGNSLRETDPVPMTPFHATLQAHKFERQTSCVLATCVRALSKERQFKEMRSG